MSFYNRKKRVSDHVYADTVVWECRQCDCWSRVEFVDMEKPNCPFCHSNMQTVSKNIRIE